MSLKTSILQVILLHIPWPSHMATAKAFGWQQPLHGQLGQEGATGNWATGAQRGLSMFATYPLFCTAASQAAFCGYMLLQGLNAQVGPQRTGGMVKMWMLV